MFNEEMKTQFIREVATDDLQTADYQRLFRKSGKFETEWGIDICHADLAQTQAVVDEVIGFRAWGKNKSVGLLTKYIEWCKNKGVQSVSDAIYHVDTSGVVKMRNQTVRSPQQLSDYLDRVFGPRNDTTRAILKAYFWLAFCGVYHEDVFFVKSSDVDLETMTIHIHRYGNERQYPIYREALDVFRHCVKDNTFVYVHTDPDWELPKERCAGDLLLRGIKTKNSIETISENRLLSGHRKCRNRLKKEELEQLPDLTYLRVWYSGLFCRAFQEEITGRKVDFKWTARESALHDITEKGYTEEELSQRINYAAIKLKRDYTRWKKTFLG